MKRFTKAIIFLLLGLTILSTTKAFAQGRGSRTQNIQDANYENPANVSQLTFDVAPNEITALGCMAGICLDPDTGQPIYGTSAMLTVNQTLASLMTNPPIETSEYIYYALNNAGIVPQAYAQGIGFSSLSPVLQLWKAFRNLSYFFFIIIFVVIGFMIMFRAQLDPQTVVTVQAALPKLVITLLLITFSYAIAGFVVDLIYFVILIVTGVMQSAGILSSANQARDVIFNKSVFRIGWSYFVFDQSSMSAANAISALIQGSLGIPNLIITDWIIDALAYLIIAFAILIQLFRTLFSLIMAWIGIILRTIFSPMILLTNALPQASTFSGWIKGIAADAAVFPAVAIMILIGSALMGGQSVDELGIETGGAREAGLGAGDGFVPPLVTTSRGDPSENEEFGIVHARALIGLGIIMILPELAKQIKGALGVESELGALAGQNLQRGTGIITKPLGFVGGMAGQVVGTAGGMIIGGKIRSRWEERQRRKVTPDETSGVRGGEELSDEKLKEPAA